MPCPSDPAFCRACWASASTLAPWICGSPSIEEGVVRAWARPLRTMMSTITSTMMMPPTASRMRTVGTELAAGGAGGGGGAADGGAADGGVADGGAAEGTAAAAGLSGPDQESAAAGTSDTCGGAYAAGAGVGGGASGASDSEDE